MREKMNVSLLGNPITIRQAAILISCVGSAPIFASWQGVRSICRLIEKAKHNSSGSIFHPLSGQQISLHHPSSQVDKRLHHQTSLFAHRKTLLRGSAQLVAIDNPGEHRECFYFIAADKLTLQLALFHPIRSPSAHQPASTR